MLFKYSVLAVIISISCAMDAGLPAATLAQFPAAVSSEGETLLEAAQIDIKNKNYSEAIQILEKAVVIFEAKGDLKSKAISLKKLGNCYYFLKQYSQAIDYYQRSLQLARSIRDRDTESRTLNNFGKYSELIDYYQQSLKITRQIGSRSIGNRLVERINLDNLGTIHQKLGRYSEAISYYQQALKVARQIGHNSAKGIIFDDLGNIYQKLGIYSEAIGYYQQALKIYQQMGNRIDEGNALGNLGNTYQKLGRYSEAIGYYQQALKIALEMRNRSGEGNALGNLGNTYQKLGRYPEAINYYQQALKINQQMGNRSGEEASLDNLGNVYQKLGRHPEVINYYQQALKINQQMGNRSGEGASLDNLGNVYQKLGRHPEVINYYQQALKINQQMGNRSGEGASLDNLGNVYQKLGRYPEAIDYHQQALKIALEIGSRSGEGNALSNLGNIYQSLGRYREAIDYHQQALKIVRQIGDRFGEGNALGNLGNVYQNLGEDSEANDYYQKALKIALEIGDRFGEGNALGSLGNIYRNLGVSIDYHQQALKIALEIGSRSGEGNALSNLGNVYQRLGRYREAIDYHQQALKIVRQIGDRSGEGNALGNLGNVYQKLGKYREAIDYLQQATNIKDSLRINLKDKDKVSLFQTQINSYKQLASALLQNQDLPGSLIATERGRARAFSDLISQRLEANPTITKPNTLNFAQIQTQAISRQATIVFYSIISDFNSKSGRNKPYKVLIHLIDPTGKITVRESVIFEGSNPDQLVNSNRTELLASRSSNKLLIDQLKPKMLVRLNDDEPDTRRQIVAVDTQRQTIVLQGIGQNDRETEEVAFSDIAGITLPADRPELRKLHQLLIAPIADLLPTNPLAPVIFIPDGALYEVPFAALKNERGQYLIDLHTISIAPSLSILAQTAQLKQRNIPRTAPSLVIGNPDFSKLKQHYEQLQFSGDEAQRVSALFPSQLLLGDRATESAVKQSLPTARIAHFATHGIRDGSNGLNSGIVLTPSGTDSGILTAEKVLDLKLRADLVVLSACDTGRGEITGDGVIGLSRSFITAGANSVIVSLWSVDDKATAMLMTDFYQQWQGGKSKAQALRAAMLNTKAQYPDPYYWSSMSLYGEID